MRPAQVRRLPRELKRPDLAKVGLELPSVRAREVFAVLAKAGFERWRQRGSHLTMYRASDGQALTVPIHFAKTVPKGTLRAIIRRAGLTVEGFNSLR